MSARRLAVRNSAFDALGPPVHQCTLPTGRTVRYLDEGRSDWPVLLFFGGAGTSVRAFRLVEFARSFREELGIRVVSVERNGVGLTPYDPACGLAEHAQDVWALLDRLGVERAAVAAISGGGPYAAHVLAARPTRISSVHLACAYAEALDVGSAAFDAVAVEADPVAWWTFPANSAVHRIPGFVESAAEEASHALAVRGRGGRACGLRQAFDLYRRARLPELSAVTAPVHPCWGADDPLVPLAHLERWREALPAVHTSRVYPGERHDVQYRHWDQILCDVRHGGRLVVLTARGVTFLAEAEDAERAIAGGAGLGLAAWH